MAAPSADRRIRARREAAVILAALFVDLVAFSSLFGGRDPAQGAARIAIPIYAAVGFIPLLWRHRWPVMVFCVVLAQCLLTPLTLPDYHPTAGLLVAVSAVAAGASRRVSLVALALTALPFSFAVRYAGAVETNPDLRTGAQFLSAIGYALLAVGAWGVGYWAGRSRRRLQQLEDQHRLDEEAVTQERLRIARELHDIVANAISVMVLHADGAKGVMDQDPERAKLALNTIKETGKQADDELRLLLGVLRVEPADGTGQDERSPGQDEAVGRRPVPRLAEVDRVVKAVRASGIHVGIEQVGQPRPLDQSVDLAAYRVVQEALTNVTKHAGPGTSAQVSMTWDDNWLTLRVRDDGTGSHAHSGREPGRHTGHGLVGLGERVAIAKGTLQAKPTGGGFEVTVRLPCAATNQSPRPEAEAGDLRSPSEEGPRR
jgi:signal transduction histidine kinase